MPMKAGDRSALIDVPELDTVPSEAVAERLAEIGKRYRVASELGQERLAAREDSVADE
jgi:hypothetical protein